MNVLVAVLGTGGVATVLTTWLAGRQTKKKTAAETELDKANVWTALVKDLQAQNERVEVQNKRVEEESARTRAENGRIRVQLELTRKEMERTRAEMRSTRDENTELRAQVARLQETVDTFTRLLSEHQIEIPEAG